jgi:hypothetical protein
VLGRSLLCVLAEGFATPSGGHICSQTFSPPPLCATGDSPCSLAADNLVSDWGGVWLHPSLLDSMVFVHGSASRGFPGSQGQCPRVWVSQVMSCFS